MTASRPDIEFIFHTAREIRDPDRRRAYVGDACGGDEALISHVEALPCCAALASMITVGQKPAISSRNCSSFKARATENPSFSPT